MPTAGELVNSQGCADVGWPGSLRPVPRAARIPADLANRPFNLNEAREHGLTKHHLVGAQWRRLGGGYYASSAIADAPMVRLTAALRRLPDGGGALWAFSCLSSRPRLSAVQPDRGNDQRHITIRRARDSQKLPG